jgi:hypothetical protein
MTLFMQFTSDVINSAYFLCSEKEQATKDLWWVFTAVRPSRRQKEYRTDSTWTKLVERYFIHSPVCLTIGPTPLPERALHIVRSRASSFRCEYPLLSLRSSSSFLRLLPRLPVNSIPPFIFPSTTYRRSQFLRKMWPIHLVFRLLISRGIFLCSLTPTLLHFSHARSNLSSPSFSSTIFQNFQSVSDLLSEASKFQQHGRFGQLKSKYPKVTCQSVMEWPGIGSWHNLRHVEWWTFTRLPMKDRPSLKMEAISDFETKENIYGQNRRIHPRKLQFSSTSLTK